MNRRTCLRRLSLVAPAMMLPFQHASSSSLKSHEEGRIRELARDFMERYSATGLSIAVAHREKIVLQEALGFADEVGREVLTPDHLFRIASVSKPITAVAIFHLIEEGKLRLTDKVFGADGLLPAFSNHDLPDRVLEVTLHHLLTHTSGGWGNDRDDPMFQHPELDHDDLITRTLQTRPLSQKPGSAYSYSNFGYCLLGRIIEKVSGKSYEGFVQEKLLEPSGIEGMRVGRNILEERAAGEVVYHGQNGENPYTMNVSRMDAHGGWIGRPSDLVKFLTRVDGNPGRPDLLRQESLAQMFRGTKVNPGYASGWSVNGAPNHWHNGSLPGTSTLAVITASGLCWAAFTNTRSEGISGALDRLMWDIVKSVPDWQPR